MLCAIYKSSKKAETYLYIEKRDDFSKVPDALKATFGKPEFVLMLNLSGGKTLVNADKQKVQESLQTEGFYLQLPPKQENLLEQHRSLNKVSQQQNDGHDA